ncbi:hypothetical protein [Paenarthrobacter aurescens]|uniref:WXG100 family type VII secretion target n=1 Tax=Paenarthrobacter aurescens TaxID=43663 RepID=A0A4Y3NB74_PAEAU|nr:hypothetical protein [Paenarthrobacter aurescens]UKA50106.1 hypothetical protein LFT48_00725 [Arthrobacter sp. FW305-123]MDO6141833.1 hypothetical protein [Paenarthrobacter aurescens]MDO6149596.1 hypothetical protein [Paenarthrobacter aurescens]MDO6156882.1 hypothetical protein [Paenarthrobacter aurescens]MDO6160868.1 hypothetical protein [Paenarthrobacter aurescens]
MAGFYGADIAQLRSLAGVMGKAADAISLQSTQLSNAINSTTAWQGRDATVFKGDWNSQHRQSLVKAANMLRENASQLKKHANQQEFASHNDGSGTSVGVLKDVYDTAMGVKGVAAPLWTAYKYLKLGNAEWVKTREVLTNWRAGGTVVRDAMTALRNGEKVTDVLTDLKANIPYSQAFQDASKFSKGLRVAGALAAPLNIVGGISDIINPQHDGWRGTGDRIAGGLSVVGGVGSIMLMTAGGAALLGPIGAPIVIGAGIVAGAWALGNLVADNWDSISNFARNPGSYIADGAKEVAGFAKDVGSKVADGVSDAAKSVGNFVGGIFG